MHTLEGHKNVVYAIAFNNPFGYSDFVEQFSLETAEDIFFFFSSDKIATGSFDKTACIWSTERGTCYHTLRGHTGEVVRIEYVA